MENNQIPTGVIADPRTDVQKAQDYTSGELIAGAVQSSEWLAKTSWVTLDIRKQITSTSCGGQSGAKILTAFFNLICSAGPIFRFRSNFSGEGMYQQDIGSILKNKQTTSEALCPSENMTDDQLNTETIPTTLPYGIEAYYFIETGGAVDMDIVASALASGHGLIFQIGSNLGEWTDVPEFNSQPVTFEHFVACVPQNFLLYENEKAVVIDDSCNLETTYVINGNPSGQRILTEAFINARCGGILALVPKMQYEPAGKPQHTFFEVLTFGSTGPEVVAWQHVLQYEKFLPTSTGNNVPLPLGYFGPMTAKATQAWQLAHGIDDFQGVTDMQKIEMGNKTIEEANTIYA